MLRFLQKHYIYSTTCTLHTVQHTLIHGTRGVCGWSIFVSSAICKTITLSTDYPSFVYFKSIARKDKQEVCKYAARKSNDFS